MTRLTRQILVFTLGLGVPSWAAADQPMTGSGTCTGMVDGVAIAGTTSMWIKDAPVDLSKGHPFGKAECECHSRDVQMRVVMQTTVSQVGALPQIAMWTGDDVCSDSARRVPGARCEQITTNNPPGNSQFKLDASSFRQTVPIDIGLPGEAITTPQSLPASMTPTYSCDTGGPQNYTVQVLLGPSGPSPATCKLPLAVNTRGPTAPTLDTVGSGNSALTVRWSVPTGTTDAQYYQVLCRSKNSPNTPVMSEDFLSATPYYFSACIDGVLYRRPLNSANTNTTEARPGLGATPVAGKFLVDPRFICSDRITATTTDLSARIEGLNNGEDYEVMVVAIDGYGNATESAVVIGTPQPTKGLLDDVCTNEANCPTGFGCSALGASASPSSLLPVATFVLLLGRSRRRRAR